MKINFKKSLSILAVCTVLFFQGCGGGSTKQDGGNDPIGGGDDPIGGTDGKYKYDRVSIAGSSITWGAGLLGEKSYVGEVERYLREEVATTIIPTLNADEILDENMSYKGKLYKYNANSEISGTIIGDKINIVFASSSVDTVVEMIADGNSLGEYTIESNANIKPVKLYPDVGRYSFRETDARSVKEWSLGDNNNEEHTFILKVKQGTLLLNFITNHMYYFQNAGIGGYAASTFLTTDSNSKTTTKEIIDFKPDLFIFESSTNDAQPWTTENANSTNNWIIQNFEDFAKEASNKIRLSRNVNVIAGDVVVMGEYNGDIGTLAVGIVKEASSSNIITLTADIPDGITLSCKIKRISRWENNVKEVINRVTSGVSNDVAVGIGTSGVPNYDPTYTDFARRLMGYREKGKIMATANGWMFFDFFQKTLEVNPGIDDQINDWSNGDNTHPNSNGYLLFGQAVTDVLKTK